ncbi:MAG: N-acetyltransferase [Gemmatimonadota bacterium]
MATRLGDTSIASAQPLVVLGTVDARRSVDAAVSALPLEEVVVRPAVIGDMKAVEPLVRTFANENLMLPKAYDQLARNFREFVVATAPAGQVIGCGALRIYSESLAEICSLAVARPMQGSGVGRLVVQRLLDEARGLNVATVFALTLRPEFFERNGFSRVPREMFPLKVWADCRNCPKLHACDEIAVAIDI